MAPMHEADDAEPDDQKAGADLNVLLPLDQREQQRERKDHGQHRQ
jgi:hypothetical protein